MTPFVLIIFQKKIYAQLGSGRKPRELLNSFYVNPNIFLPLKKQGCGGQMIVSSGDPVLTLSSHSHSVAKPCVPLLTTFTRAAACHHLFLFSRSHSSNLPLWAPPTRPDCPFRCSSCPTLPKHISQHSSLVSDGVTSQSISTHCWSGDPTKIGVHCLVLHVLSQALQDADASSRKWGAGARE